MRTDPFRDGWLFMIGSTPDHQALGLLRYLFVALFLVLLAASVWIALQNWIRDPVQRTLGHLATWISRVLVGSMWFQGCLWKLPLPVAGGFEYWTGQMGDHAAFAFQRDLVKRVFLPHLTIIDPLVFLAELAFAVSLILGVGVRLVATVATVYVLNLWLGLYRHPGEWPWNYVFLALVHVLFAVSAAGRSLGVDALLRRDKPKTVIGRLLAVMG
jgi:uncharacterized membrane protein YphA (DoxX/SURF4 family)